MLPNPWWRGPRRGPGGSVPSRAERAHGETPAYAAPLSSTLSPHTGWLSSRLSGCPQALSHLLPEEEAPSPMASRRHCPGLQLAGPLQPAGLASASCILHPASWGVEAGRGAKCRAPLGQLPRVQAPSPPGSLDRLTVGKPKQLHPGLLGDSQTHGGHGTRHLAPGPTGRERRRALCVSVCVCLCVCVSVCVRAHAEAHAFLCVVPAAVMS